jgi:ABC-type multidrug transport system ATPase subunit
VIDKLIQGLAAGSDLTAEEILDVLWLAAIRAGPQPALPVVGRANSGVTSGPTGLGSPQSPRADTTSLPWLALPGDRRPTASLPMRLPTGASRDDHAADTAERPGPQADEDEPPGERIPATEVGFGSPQQIREAARIPRALVRLRQIRRPSPRLAVDIDATVEATADAGGTLVPVFTRPPERSLDLALVVDGAPAMRIWDDTFDEFARLMVQTGAFRSVERWRLVTDGGVSLSDASGKIQSPRRLIDPSGRRVVFVATSASADGWYTAGPWEAIASWCAAMPTALIQVLPRQYWAGTALGEPYITVRAPRPAAPNGQYASRVAWWAHDPGGLPLPVMMLTPDALETWAQAAVNGTAWALGITATPPDPDYAPSAAIDVRADMLVNDFLSRASPGAERLARVLATAATLSMPLIAVLQETLAPRTGVLELAETLSSGLLSVDDSGGQPRFRFRDDTREILCRGMTTFEEWDAYDAVSRYLESRHRLGGPLRALIPDPDGSAVLDPTDEPFAALHEALATRLGLRAILEAQETASPPAPGPQSPTAVTSKELRALLGQEIGLIRRPGDSLTIATFGAVGLEGWRVTRDGYGTPAGVAIGALPWEGLHPDASGFGSEVDRLLDAGTIHRALFILTALDHPDADAALRIAAGLSSRTSDSVRAYDVDVAQAIREAIARSPLTCSYELLTLNRGSSGRFSAQYVPLFPPGAVPGDRKPLRIQCLATGKHGTVFVVKSSSDAPMLVTSARVEPGTYTLTAVLLEPGVVRFEGLPTQPQHDLRPWPDVMAMMREWIDKSTSTVPGPASPLPPLYTDPDRTSHFLGSPFLERLSSLGEDTDRPDLVSTLGIGRSPDNEIVVPDPSVSRRHANLRISPTGRHRIVDMGSRNGTFVNGVRVSQAALNDNDTVTFGSATFLFTGGELRQLAGEDDAPIVAAGEDGALIVAEDLGVTVEDGGRVRVLLDQISFVLPERCLMAVIGPAGAGKTTLFNALTGMRPADRGTLVYDGRDLYQNYGEIQHRIGIVPQESSPSNVGTVRRLGFVRRVTSALRQSTPRNALRHAGRLNFPRDTSEAERNQRVEAVLAELSLTAIADIRIDRLSPSQRRRVDIGLALLTRPSLLFFDDPASTLDPHLKRAFFTELRGLAVDGRSVVVFTSDIDSTSLGLCDLLLVLAPGGTMAYFGPPTGGLSFFNQQDWAGVFQTFAEQPQRDWSAPYRASPEFATHVAPHLRR